MRGQQDEARALGTHSDLHVGGGLCEGWAQTGALMNGAAPEPRRRQSLCPGCETRKPETSPPNEAIPAQDAPKPLQQLQTKTMTPKPEKAPHGCPAPCALLGLWEVGQHACGSLTVLLTPLCHPLPVQGRTAWGYPTHTPLLNMGNTCTSSRHSSQGRGTTSRS